MINLTIYDSYDDGKKFLKELLFNFFDCEEYNLLSDDNKTILCKLLNHFNNSDMKISLLEGERQSGITSILRAFIIYACSKQYEVLYFGPKNDSKNFVNSIYSKYGFRITYKDNMYFSDSLQYLFNENKNKVIVFDLYRIYDMSNFINYIHYNTKNPIIIGTTYNNLTHRNYL